MIFKKCPKNSCQSMNTGKNIIKQKKKIHDKNKRLQCTTNDFIEMHINRFLFFEFVFWKTMQ